MLIEYVSGLNILALAFLSLFGKVLTNKEKQESRIGKTCTGSGVWGLGVLLLLYPALALAFPLSGLPQAVSPSQGDTLQDSIGISQKMSSTDNLDPSHPYVASIDRRCLCVYDNDGGKEFCNGDWLTRAQMNDCTEVQIASVDELASASASELSIPPAYYTVYSLKTSIPSQIPALNLCDGLSSEACALVPNPLDDSVESSTGVILSAQAKGSADGTVAAVGLADATPIKSFCEVQYQEIAGCGTIKNEVTCGKTQDCFWHPKREYCINSFELQANTRFRDDFVRKGCERVAISGVSVAPDAAPPGLKSYFFTYEGHSETNSQSFNDKVYGLLDVQAATVPKIVAENAGCNYVSDIPAVRKTIKDRFVPKLSNQQLTLIGNQTFSSDESWDQSDPAFEPWYLFQILDNGVRDQYPVRCAAYQDSECEANFQGDYWQHGLQFLCGTTDASNNRTGMTLMKCCQIGASWKWRRLGDC